MKRGLYDLLMAAGSAVNDMALRRELFRAARYSRSNPLGGPAKVFDAMADRIRAGENYWTVIRDNGFRAARRRKRK